MDTDNQAEDNYDYDRIGNLKKAAAEGITSIDWTVYGKIKNISKAAAPNSYGYDASGDRIVKEVTVDGITTKTFYVRDAS